MILKEKKYLKTGDKYLGEIIDNYPKYIITLDYDTNNYNGIKQISAIGFLLGRVDLLKFAYNIQKHIFCTYKSKRIML